MNRLSIRRLAIGAAVLVAAGGTTALTAGSAGAADPSEPTPIATAVYDASGSVHIAKGNFNVPINPTKLTADLSQDPEVESNLDLVGTLPVPPVTVSFKAFGYLPVRAKVYFTQVGPVTGYVSFSPPAASAHATAKYVVTLRDVYVGYTKANVGDNCQTRYPVELNVNSDEGFSLEEGSLSATFDLGKFNNCSTSTDLTNLIVPSNGNTLKLNVSNLQLLDPGTPAATQAKARAKAQSKALSAAK